MAMQGDDMPYIGRWFAAGGHPGPAQQEAVKKIKEFAAHPLAGRQPLAFDCSSGGAEMAFTGAKKVSMLSPSARYCCTGAWWSCAFVHLLLL